MGYATTLWKATNPVFTLQRNNYYDNAAGTFTATAYDHWLYLKSTVASGQEMFVMFYAPETGTYALDLYYVKAADAGILTFYLDHALISSTPANVDLYAGSTAYGNAVTVQLGAILKGWHIFSIYAATKNGASSNYAIYIHGFDLAINL